MYRTYSVSKKNTKHEWHFLDATDAVLGRFATKIAKLLLGKDKENYSSHINVGDKVVVVNAEKIKVTGNKMNDKMYYHHSGYPGGFKEETLSKLIERKPDEIIRKAVWGMIPTNKLRKVRMANLYIYKGSEHKHNAQVAK